MTENVFKNYNHLGFHNPYYLIKRNKINIEQSFEKIIELIPVEERVLDFTALVEVFSTGYCFGDRTLIKRLKKTPWMAKPNQSLDNWEYFKVPDHGEVIQDSRTIAEKFYLLLKDELKEYILPHQNIGILLTGGMDSRIVAAVLKKMLEDGEMIDKKVYAYTWGHEKSRDVVYASRIADLYGWEWNHLIVDENQMILNCMEALNSGCEFTPIHLHAMSQITQEKHLDCVIAGSFGDSVGRAEFSGKKVREIDSITNKIKNVGGILRRDFSQLVTEEINQDIIEYHKLFPQQHLFQQYEQDQQLHYMRRMLNACMTTIDKKIPLYQAFSSPKVFGYMWSLSPEGRTDEIYKVLLESVDPMLLKIPWARTGLRYPKKKGNPDNFKKSHHDYGQLIRECFLNSIEETVNNNLDQAAILFDILSLKKMILNCKKLPMPGKLLYEEKLLYVKQVLDFITKFNVKIDLPKYKSNWLLSLKEDGYYKGRYFYNKVK